MAQATLNFGGSEGEGASRILTAPFDREKEEFRLKKDFALQIMRVFLWANGVVLILIAVSLVADWYFLGCGLIEPEERLVSENVLMTLLGATTVQVGAIVVTITNHLFPKKP